MNICPFSQIDTSVFINDPLGGRIKHRTLTQQEAVYSAASTALFALKHGALDIVINCQYVDPINRADERRNGISYYIPSREDIMTTVLLVTPHLDRNRRIRMCLDKEDIIEGTRGPADCDPNIDSGFKSLISGFNNAENQRQYFERYLAV